MEKIFYTRHDGGLTLFKSGKHSTVSSTHINFARIVEALKARRFDDVESLMNIGATITKFGISKKFKDRSIFVEKGEVYWNDGKTKQKLAGPLVDRILDSLGTKAGEKFADALLMLLDNIKKNSAKDISEELYQWLMSGKAPITYDGCFLAYKKVNSNFMDIYTGKIDNSPGKNPRMPESEVDKNRNNQCSRGLHFCSRGYLSSYSGNTNCKVVIVKVNPRKVFAIPRDYSFQKGRASEYFVVGEFKGNWQESEAFKTSFVDEDTKQASMPEVEFVGWLKPSLESLGESFGLVANKKAMIMTRRGVYVPVREGKNGNYVDILGTPVVGDGPKEMSIETKSVREALKNAIRKADKSYKA